MQLLHAEHLKAFEEGLKRRIQVENDFSLFPVLGAIRWIGRITFCCVYTDVVDPLCCSYILIKVKPVTEQDVEDKVTEGVDVRYIHQRWLNEMDEERIRFEQNYWVCFWTMKNLSNLDLTFFTGLLDSRDYPIIKAVDYTLLEKFSRSCQDFDLPVLTKAFVCSLLGKPPGVLCPEGYAIRVLGIDDCKTAMLSYKYARFIQNNLMLCTAHGYGVGAFEIESGKLVTSVFLNWEGAIAGLQTEKAHRKKGLATAVVSTLANMLYGEGLPIFCYVERSIDTTESNIALFKKMGFVVDEKLSLSWTRSQK